MNLARRGDVALHTIGVCHYGATQPFQTVEIAAASPLLAMTKAWVVLQPNHVQRLCHVSTRPLEVSQETETMH